MFDKNEQMKKYLIKCGEMRHTKQLNIQRSLAVRLVVNRKNTKKLHKINKKITILVCLSHNFTNL